MTEETPAREGGADAIVEHETLDEATKVETPETETSEDTAEQDTGTEESGQADETSDTPKRKPWWEKRFDELTAKRYDAEREAAYWRGIAEGRTPQQPAQQEGPPDRWEDPEGYDRWLIDQATQAFEQRHQKQTVLRTFEERAAQFRQSKPDFDSVVRNPSVRITPTMADVIRESDVGPQVAYHLGTHMEEAARIASLPHHRQAAELGRLEVKLSAPPEPARVKPIPPAPPSTVGAVSSGLSKPLEEMSMAEYIAARKADQT